MNEKFIRGFGKKNILSSMIKTFLIILGVFGLFISSNVNAVTLDNDTTSNDATVSVGEVEVPVFEVSIVWGDLTFNWEYNRDLNEYVWMAQTKCNPVADVTEDELLIGRETYYTDSACSMKASAASYTEETTYYKQVQYDYVELGIIDDSTGTQVVPSIKWVSSENYSYVNGKIQVKDLVCVAVDNQKLYDEALGANQKFYSDAACSVETTTDNYSADKYYLLVYKNVLLETEEIPDTARVAPSGYILNYDDFAIYVSDKFKNAYYLYFSLVNTSTPETAPTAGDTIGTITISIRAK